MAAVRPLWLNETVKEIGVDQDTAFTTHGAFALAVRNEAGASVRFKPVRGSVNDLAVVDRFISRSSPACSVPCEIRTPAGAGSTSFRS